jgi:phage major tail protein, TP901-1 family
MVAQKVKDLLLKIFNRTSYETVAGPRSKWLAFNAENVDVTPAESAGRWRSCWGAGVQRASVSGAGIFKDAASDDLVRNAFFNASILSWQIIVARIENCSKHQGLQGIHLPFRSLEYIVWAKLVSIESIAHGLSLERRSASRRARGHVALTG